MGFSVASALLRLAQRPHDRTRISVPMMPLEDDVEACGSPSNWWEWVNRVEGMESL